MSTVVTWTTHERIERMYGHREADRVPIWETPWRSTIERWRGEGMPTDDYGGYFDIARIGTISVDNSPQYPVSTLEETSRYAITTTPFGVTVKNWRHTGGVPEFLHHTIVDRTSWAEAKARMKPSSDRVNWEYLRRNYAGWRKEGYWITGGLWFGFDVTHARIVGTERVLMALCDDPEWIMDMINTMLDLDLALLDMVWEAGYTFDELYWPDDLGYKHHQFMSPQMYREIVKPAHRRAAEWAHAKGIKVRLHSCGCVSPFIPDFIDLGVDMLNPLEVKAGMEPLALKAEFGEKLTSHGGLNAALYWHPEQMWTEMRELIPKMKENGGYVIATDHSVPDIVSLDTFGEFVRLAKELGSYS